MLIFTILTYFYCKYNDVLFTSQRFTVILVTTLFSQILIYLFNYPNIPPIKTPSLTINPLFIFFLHFLIFLQNYLKTQRYLLHFIFLTINLLYSWFFSYFIFLLFIDQDLRSWSKLKKLIKKKLITVISPLKNMYYFLFSSTNIY